MEIKISFPNSVCLSNEFLLKQMIKRSLPVGWNVDVKTQFEEESNKVLVVSSDYPLERREMEKIVRVVSDSIAINIMCAGLNAPNLDFHFVFPYKDKITVINRKFVKGRFVE